MNAGRGDVFVIDDESAVRKSLGLLLRVEGYRVQEFERGEDALAALDARTPHGVITDYHMPGLSGGEVVQRIRRMHPKLPIVMLTGRDDSVRIELDATVRLLQKPVDANVLLDLLRVLVAAR